VAGLRPIISAARARLTACGVSMTLNVAAWLWTH
jgi:hypothetical protein